MSAVPEPLRAAIIGCGDFLRCQERALLASTRLRVTAVCDPDPTRAQRAASTFSARIVTDASALCVDPQIDVVLLFVPPWVRSDLLVTALDAGKDIITTKPLAAADADCTRLETAVAASGRRCAVIYNRSESPWVHTLDRVLEAEGLGRCVLYKHDWIHHYPQWNNWATDPVRNGGPFLDAMIHNLNAARHLIGRPLRSATMFSQRLVQDIPCADTEALHLDFDGASAQLFITWAAELATWSRTGNDREHFDQHFIVTAGGWHCAPLRRDGREWLRATRRGEERWWPLQAAPGTLYDAFTAHCQDGEPWPQRLATVAEAALDVQLIRRSAARAGQPLPWPEADRR